ncbi:hypothetical protein DFP72DRAFT_846367 [Ephemerocybe angulata]|uniref:Uncharacterized protein n=1 Tax=Ephemerocybe angulata TaxID=980116 RepID=A0A8H6I439_9AGAR|nr:hypothetical protein DFP72DRAFT_846367 [Tulosesus angulatus]
MVFPDTLKTVAIAALLAAPAIAAPLSLSQAPRNIERRGTTTTSTVDRRDGALEKRLLGFVAGLPLFHWHRKDAEAKKDVPTNQYEARDLNLGDFKYPRRARAVERRNVYAYAREVRSMLRGKIRGAGLSSSTLPVTVLHADKDRPSRAGMQWRVIGFVSREKVLGSSSKVSNNPLSSVFVFLVRNAELPTGSAPPEYTLINYTVRTFNIIYTSTSPLLACTVESLHPHADRDRPTDAHRRARQPSPNRTPKYLSPLGIFDQSGWWGPLIYHLARSLKQSLYCTSRHVTSENGRTCIERKYDDHESLALSIIVWIKAQFVDLIVGTDYRHQFPRAAEGGIVPMQKTNLSAGHDSVPRHWSIPSDAIEHNAEFTARRNWNVGERYGLKLVGVNFFQAY